MKFKKIILGGTFDHFHRGHEALISKAFELGEQVILGITSQMYVQKNKEPRIKNKGQESSSLIPHSLFLIQSYDVRKAAVENFLKERNWFTRCEIISIDDRFGTTLADSSLEAIVVSPETEETAHEINQKRAEIDFPALEIITVPWVLAADKKQINSIRIRAGEIDRIGAVFRISYDWGTRKISTDLRQQLKKPFGDFVPGNSENLTEAIQKLSTSYKLLATSYLVTVGDAVTASFLKAGIVPTASIIDYHIQREKAFKHITDLGFDVDTPVVVAKNPAGTLSYELFETMKSFLVNPIAPKVLVIEGEEDLTVLFAAALLPLGAFVIYGQPNEGIVVIEITIEKKQEVMKILKQFNLL